METTTIKKIPNFDDVISALNTQDLYQIEGKDLDKMMERVRSLARSSQEFRTELISTYRRVLDGDISDEELRAFFIKYASRLTIIDIKKFWETRSPVEKMVAVLMPQIYIGFVLTFLLHMIGRTALNQDSGFGTEFINFGPLAKESLSLNSLAHITRSMIILNGMKRKESNLEDSPADGIQVAEKFLKVNQTEG